MDRLDGHARLAQEGAEDVEERQLMTGAEDILRCPACGQPLSKKKNELICKSCGTNYHKLEDFWDLIPAASSSLKLSEREHYSQKSHCYAEMHEAWADSPFYRHYHDSFLDELRRLPDESLILETGCGLGHDGLELLRAGCRLVETDIAVGQLAQARQLHSSHGLERRSEYLLADAEYLPFVDASFDGALMVASLHHLQDPARALGEMRRVLRDGGVLVLGTEPNNWQNFTIYPLGKLLMKAVHRLTKKEIASAAMVSEADKLMEGFSGKQLRDLLSRAGFENIQLKPAGYFSAAIFFATTEASFLTGRDLRMFRLERLALALDEYLAKLPVLSRYPWHWNVVAK
jgi:ubiquinone/menaquinone biosynthesis C-methylase UbiE